LASTFGNGDGGDLTVTATNVELIGTSADAIFPSALGASVQQTATGNGGTLTLNTQRLLVRDGAQVLASTFGNGDGGDLTVTANDVELLGSGSGLAASVEQAAIGNGGTLTLETQRLLVRDGAFVSTGTFGNGDGGDLTVTANDVELVGSGSNLSASTETFGNGNSGNLTLETENLSVRDGAQVLASTFGNGDGGDLTVTATNVELIGTSADAIFPSGLAASVEQTATGNGGTLTLNTQRLLVRDGAQISTSTFGNGDGGDLTVTANDVELVGSGSNLSASTETFGNGNSGNLTLETENLSVRDGAQVLASTFGNGDGGDLTVTATNVELIGTSADAIFPSALAASVQQTAIGNGGTLTLETQRLSVRDGAQISTSTFGNGDGGDLTVTANDVELIGTSADAIFPSALFASAFSTSTSRAGTLTVNAENLTVRDGATIDVRSDTSEAAGNLEINAPFILLDNRGSLNADTTAGQGNIIVNTDDLRLRRNSNITTNARGEATGGNIILNTKTLVAIEDSDISANAQQAFGGQVIVNANAIFGTQFRTQSTGASDITATSELGPQFSGTVELNNEIDPAQGLVDLPQTVVDPAALIAQDACKKGQYSSFVNTGRGGLPPSPQESLRSEETLVPLIELPPDLESRHNHTPSQKSRVQSNTSTSSNQPVSSLDIVPARGWIRTENGDVILVGYDPTQTGVQRQPQPLPNQCNSEE
jgi:large exoprotein involved in heme utilization and adhesion